MRRARAPPSSGGATRTPSAGGRTDDADGTRTRSPATGAPSSGGAPPVVTPGRGKSSKRVLISSASVRRGSDAAGVDATATPPRSRSSADPLSHGFDMFTCHREVSGSARLSPERVCRWWGLASVSWETGAATSRSRWTPTARNVPTASTPSTRLARADAAEVVADVVPEFAAAALAVVRDGLAVLVGVRHAALSAGELRALSREITALQGQPRLGRVPDLGGDGCPG